MEPQHGRSWVGRTRELAQLDRAFVLAANGQPQVVLVLGPTGVGKSSLIRRAAEGAGVPLRAGACLPLGSGEVPFLPFIELLRGMVTTMPSGDLLRVLGGARGEVARLLPELGPTTRREEDPGLARAILFEQLRGVAERLGAAAPRILAIEDLQWADASTRDLVLFLARNVRDSRILLLLTCRTDDLGPGHPFPAFAAELERGGNVERLELTGLAAPEVADQVTAILGRAAAPDLVRRLAERTGGNPLFTEALLAGVPDGADLAPDAPLPPRLRDALVARLARLTADGRRTAGLVAVAGRHGTDAAITALTAGDDTATEATERGLRELLESGVLVADPGAIDGTFTFRHPLLREIAEADLLPSIRRRAHAVMAGLLDLPGAGPAVTAEIAAHRSAAAEPALALAAWVRAGLAADAATAPAEALRHLERALALVDQVPDADAVAGMDRVALLAHVGDAALRAGVHDRSVEALRAALALADAAGDAERATDLRRSLRWSLWTAGRPIEALREAEAAVAALADGPPSAPRANALGHLAGLRLALGDVPGAATAAGDALTIAEQVGAREEAALSMGVLGLAELHLGSPDAGLGHVHAAWEQALALGHVSGVALAYERLAGALAALGRTEEAEALAAEGIIEADRRGLDRTFGVLLRASAADALLELGRWPEAAARIEEGLAGVPTGIEGVAVHVVAARLACGQGEATRATTHLRAARELAGLPPDTDAIDGPWAGSLAAAELDLATGRPARVRDAVDAWVTSPAAAAWPGQRAGLVLAGLAAESELATTARVHGDAAGLAVARGRADRLCGAAAAPWPGATVPLREALATAAGAERARMDGPVPEATWAAVAAAWTEAGRPIRAAAMELNAAESALAHGERSGVAARLGRALTLAVAAGARPLEARARDLARRARLDLDAAGGPPDASGDPGTPGPGPGAGTGLTSRELEVLTLLAEGRTNREIGEALFISPKTVSVHVTNLLAKLGVAGRVEAATLALRMGIVPPR